MSEFCGMRIIFSKTLKKKKVWTYPELGWDFKQDGDMVGFVFLEHHASHSKEIGLEGANWRQGSQ